MLGNHSGRDRVCVCMVSDFELLFHICSIVVVGYCEGRVPYLMKIPTTLYNFLKMMDLKKIVNREEIKKEKKWKNGNLFTNHKLI